MQNFRKLYVVIIAYKNENNNREKKSNNKHTKFTTHAKEERMNGKYIDGSHNRAPHKKHEDEAEENTKSK